jgi:uncharacterized protein
MDNSRTKYEHFLSAAGCTPDVITHCHAVCDTALDLAGQSPFVDRDLLTGGAMLHDIGRAKTHSLGHAQAGADYCRSLGMDERVCRIIERHTGAGLTPDECSLLGLAPRDCMPETIEEKIVTNADNLVRGDRRITIEESISDTFYLPKKTRRRMFRLYTDVLLLLCR